MFITRFAVRLSLGIIWALAGTCSLLLVTHSRFDPISLPQTVWEPHWGGKPTSKPTLTSGSFNQISRNPNINPWTSRWQMRERARATSKTYSLHLHHSRPATQRPVCLDRSRIGATKQVMELIVLMQLQKFARSAKINYIDSATNSRKKITKTCFYFQLFTDFYVGWKCSALALTGLPNWAVN